MKKIVVIACCSFFKTRKPYAVKLVHLQPLSFTYPHAIDKYQHSMLRPIFQFYFTAAEQHLHLPLLSVEFTNKYS